jgi:hypothetical protein
MDGLAEGAGEGHPLALRTQNRPGKQHFPTPEKILEGYFHEHACPKMAVASTWRSAPPHSGCHPQHYRT